jgi:hypothetical protein
VSLTIRVKAARTSSKSGGVLASQYPTATPQARASNEAIEAAFEVVGAALGAFRDAELSSDHPPAP